MRKRANLQKIKQTSKRREKYLETRQHQNEIVERIKKRGGHWIQKIPGVTLG